MDGLWVSHARRSTPASGTALRPADGPDKSIGRQGPYAAVRRARRRHAERRPEQSFVNKIRLPARSATSRRGRARHRGPPPRGGLPSAGESVQPTAGTRAAGSWQTPPRTARPGAEGARRGVSARARKTAPPGCARSPAVQALVSSAGGALAAALSARRGAAGITPTAGAGLGSGRPSPTRRRASV